MSSIEQEIRKNARKRRLPAVLEQKINRKLALLQGKYGIHEYNSILNFVHCPAYVLQLGDVDRELLRSFSLSTLDIWLLNRGRNGVVWCVDTGDWACIARINLELAVDNRLTEAKESWSRLSPKSKTRKDHWNTSGNRDKSRFYGNYSFIKPIELRTFESGIGLLTAHQKIYLYAEFSASIGESSNGRPLSHVRLECARTRRFTGSGFQVDIHGYPIERSQVQRAFSDTQFGIGDVPLLPNP